METPVSLDALETFNNLLKFGHQGPLATFAHLGETKSQRDQLDALLNRHGAGKREHEDGSMRTILREAERWAKLGEEPARCRL